MLLSSIRAPLVVLVACVTVVFSTPSVSALPSLIVKTTPDLDFDGVGNPKVTTTIVNTGGETLKLFNDPRGVLDPFPENSFTFTAPSGSLPSFKGARASYNPTFTAGFDDPSVFTVLSPGGSVSVTHDLSAAYDFTQSGTGEYSVEPSNRFTYIDADGMSKDLYATVGNIAKVKLSGDLGISRHVHNKRRIKFYGCGVDWKKELRANIYKAQDKIISAYNAVIYVRLNYCPRRYRLWFGGYEAHMHSSISDRLDRMVSTHRGNFMGLEFICHTIARPRNNGRSSVMYFEDDLVHVNPDFFNEQIVTREDRVHRLIRLAARRDGATAERRGVVECQDLAMSDPHIAATNADNIAYYVTYKPGLG